MVRWEYIFAGKQHSSFYSNKKNRINEAAEIDKRTVGYRRRKLSMEKGTHAMLTLLETAKKAAIPAKYVLFDSWFSSPSTLHAVKRMDFDVIGMVKKSPKIFFRYDGEDMSLISIYNKNKKRRGKSKYLLSVMVDVVKDGDIIPAKSSLCPQSQQTQGISLPHFHRCKSG